MGWKRLYRESLGGHLCEFTKDEVQEILDSNPEPENPRYDRSNIDKYLDFMSSERVFCGLLDEHGHCGALAVLEEGNPKFGYCFLLEIQCFDKGCGAKLIHQLVDKYKKVWLIADPSADDALVDYYKRPEFGFNEFVLPKSVYDAPLHVFYTKDCDSELIEITSTENWEDS